MILTTTQIRIYDYQKIPLAPPLEGYQQKLTGSHWATVTIQFNAQKFAASSLLGRLKRSKKNRAQVADGSFILTIDHDAYRP